jgi:hypothetical protein
MQPFLSSSPLPSLPSASRAPAPAPALTAPANAREATPPIMMHGIPMYTLIHPLSALSWSLVVNQYPQVPHVHASAISSWCNILFVPRREHNGVDDI